MEKEEYWEHFLMSGKVADYLDYRHAAEKMERSADSRATVFGEKDPDDKVKQHAGFY